MSLEASDLEVRYGDIVIIRNLSLRVNTGEIVGLLGRNGMGKTTLMRAVTGVLAASRGLIGLDGEDITQLPAYVRARRGIILVPQGRGVFPDLTVRENLEMGRLAARNGRDGRLEEVLDYFPTLAERMRQRAGTMSGGEQQMVAIARGLMAEPKVLLLDEPSDGIMPILVQQIAEILDRISQKEGLTMVLVEQNVSMVFRIASRCLVLEKGQIVAEGAPDDPRASRVMKEHLAI
jgi:ABC-type branched-subunit amino acid transport system ATPase component